MANIASKYPTIGGGGGLFLKLNDGDTIKVRLVSDPIYFDNEFNGTLSARIAWVIWNHDESKAQIWATNGATYNSIKDLANDDEYGDPSRYDIKITRTGTMQQTRYSVRPGVKKYDLEDAQLEACNMFDPIERIDRSESTSHVMYLEDHREDKKEVLDTDRDEEEASGHDKAKAQADKLRPKEKEESFEEEEVNLDDIPF